MGYLMNTGLISIGTGVASFAGSVVFTVLSRNLLAIPIVGLAAGAIGLLAKKQCLEEQESLTKKDWILIGGSSAVGAIAAGAAVAAVTVLVQGVFLGSMMGSFMGTLFGNMLSPINSLFIVSVRTPPYNL
jgi:integral membrane sensor domain MASE1